eukprot:TRINITY_DN13991_c0_g1_i2.p1 TRINITY_DN13991_c0_g1~~TRINITY_DN13991_c0_g1_i2.p1  ORF type:complete len:172 (-),score=47.65 TRINITY_DN13991_c0_g1_i2:188-703(-)
MAAACEQIIQFPSEAVADAIDEFGYQETYDFFYMPRRSRLPKAQSLGYAFINFKEAAVAHRFYTEAERGELILRQRVISAVPAEIQGVEELKGHFEGKAVMKSCAAPTFVEEPDVKAEAPEDEDDSASTAASSSSSSPFTPTSVVAAASTSFRLRSSSSTRWADMEEEDED